MQCRFNSIRRLGRVRMLVRLGRVSQNAWKAWKGQNACKAWKAWKGRNACVLLTPLESPTFQLGQSGMAPRFQEPFQPHLFKIPRNIPAFRLEGEEEEKEEEEEEEEEPVRKWKRTDCKVAGNTNNKHHGDQASFF